MGKLRIAVVGIMHESMVQSAVLTGRAAMHVYRGQEIVDAKLWIVAGAIDRLQKDADVELVPLLYARAWPGGMIERTLYEELKAEALDMVTKQGPFDGLICANHSAMEVEGLGQHGDTDFICALRQALGPDVPISAPFDMHGQLTPELLQTITVFSALRTAPHTDHFETGERCSDLLLRVIREKLTPKKALVRVPVLLSGEKSMTLYSPTRELFAALPEFDKRDGIMETGIFIGFGWNDLPWIGLQAVAIAESDQDAALMAAQDLGNLLWERRSEFDLKMPTAELEDGFAEALKFAEGPVILCDSGDNTTAGGDGDLTFALQQALLTPNLKDTIVAGITAPRAVEACFAAGIGNSVRLDLGSEHVSAERKILTADGIVVAVGDGPIKPPQDDNFMTDSATGKWASVRFGEVLATFHDKRIGFGSPANLEGYGIDGVAHAIYVVKIGYLLPDFAKVAKHNILLLTEGCASLDFERRKYERVTRPAFPLDKNFSFDAAENAVVA